MPLYGPKAVWSANATLLRLPVSVWFPRSLVPSFAENLEPAIEAESPELEYPFTCQGIGGSNPNSFKTKTSESGLGILCLKLYIDVGLSLAKLVPTVVRQPSLSDNHRVVWVGLILDTSKSALTFPALLEDLFFQICTQFYRYHKTLPSPPLRLHPPDPRTLMQKPFLKQCPPPPPPVIFSPLPPSHINPLISRAYFHIIIRAFPLHLSKRHHQINIPRQV